jgi:hypothetical protein
LYSAITRLVADKLLKIALSSTDKDKIKERYNSNEWYNLCSKIKDNRWKVTKKSRTSSAKNPVLINRAPLIKFPRLISAALINPLEF